MSAEKQLIKLYNGKVEIEFWPNSHRYSLKGSKEWLLSVTSITGIVDKSRFLIPWAVGECVSFVQAELAKLQDVHITKEEAMRLVIEGAEQHKRKKEAAASTGDQVHTFAEQFALSRIKQGQEPTIRDEMGIDVIRGINGFLEWYNAHDIEFLEAERVVYSQSREYVGKCDGVAIVDGKKTLLDYKTSKGIYDEYKFQVAGYRLAWEEENKKKLQQSLILHFGKETGDFQVCAIDNKNHKLDASTFGALLIAKKRLKELEKEYYVNRGKNEGNFS